MAARTSKPPSKPVQPLIRDTGYADQRHPFRGLVLYQKQAKLSMIPFLFFIFFSAQTDTSRKAPSAGAAAAQTSPETAGWASTGEAIIPPAPPDPDNDESGFSED